MSSLNRGEFETKALRTANRVCDQFRDRLAAAGLEIPAPTLSRHDSGGELTELELPVRRGSLYVAYIEYFIWRKGQPYLTIEEIQDWLEGEFEAILADQQATRQDQFKRRGLLSRLYSLFSSNRKRRARKAGD